MLENGIAARIAGVLFRHAFIIYRPLYSIWKSAADRRERAYVASILHPGMTAIDIGANIGVHTRYFANHVGSTGQVLAFEPAPTNFVHLAQATKDHTNIKAMQMAIGECTSSVRLHLSDNLNVDHQTFDAGDGRESVVVPMTSLDDHIAPGSRVDFIKIDVQGYELAVFKGAERVFLDNPDISVLSEFWPFGLRRAGTEPRDFLSYLCTKGFQVGLVPGQETISLEAMLASPETPDRYWNIVLTRNHNQPPQVI